MRVEKSMRAAVIVAPREVELREVERPVAGPGQVLVRLEGCGVCGSNLPVWQGRPWFEYPRPPGSPGHEGWGRIEEVGAGVDSLVVGQRVTFLSGGAFAEFDVADGGGCVPLPRALEEVDFPGEALGCALNVIERSGVRPGDLVAVVGSGFLGACIVRLAASAGARVIALSRRATSRAAAKRLGAELEVEIGAPDGADDAVRRVEEWSGGALCRVVFEAAGTQEALDLAARLCAVRGQLVVAGYHQDGARTVDLQLWNWRGLDVVNAHERDPARYARGMRAAIDAALGARLDPLSLITHRFPLARTAEAFRALEERPEGFMKAVVTMGEG